MSMQRLACLELCCRCRLLIIPVIVLSCKIRFSESCSGQTLLVVPTCQGTRELYCGAANNLDHS
jgi:hypothetical protein